MKYFIAFAYEKKEGDQQKFENCVLKLPETSFDNENEILRVQYQIEKQFEIHGAFIINWKELE